MIKPEIADGLFPLIGRLLFRRVRTKNGKTVTIVAGIVHDCLGDEKAEDHDVIVTGAFTIDPTNNQHQTDKFYGWRIDQVICEPDWPTSKKPKE